MTPPSDPVARSAFELEGMLTAHRQVLETLVAFLARHDGDAFRQFVEAALHFQDHAEDPGAEPGAGVAIEQAGTVELARILAAARDHASSRHGPRTA
jgi:hypothetical protein